MKGENIMALSNTATPKYYGEFRDAVMRGDIPVCREIAMEMNRIDDLIANPGIWYDDQAVNGFIEYCETELTLTDGSDLRLLDSFKLWAEQIFGWYYFVERSIYEPNPDGRGGHYVNKTVKRRLINKQYLIVARGAAKSLYVSCIQNYFFYFPIKSINFVIDRINCIGTHPFGKRRINIIMVVVDSRPLIFQK